MKHVAGKVSLVTGGTSGIGLGIAQAFVEADMKVIVTYRRAESRDQALEQLRPWSPNVQSLRLDVTDRAAVAEAALRAEALFGKIHVLVNNSAVNIFGPADEATHDDWDWVMSVNFTGVVNCLVSFLPRLKAHGEGGHVMNVGSMGCFIPSVGAGLYTASKFALRGLTESLRLTLGRHGIGVSLLCPGLTRTNIWQAALRRPPQFASSAFPISDENLARLAAVHSAGMDPLEVGRKALIGIRSNRLYVLTHPEFVDELREINEEILAAVPPGLPPAQRSEIENERKRIKASAQARAKALDS
jgi:NAD(P)-dependent dehydrogenase (short-subunit alcohol dehydrogenase family)